MASHSDDFVRQGLVEVKCKRFGTWKKRWIVLRRYSSAGPPRLEEFTERHAFHSLKDSMSTVPIRVLPLINVAGVTQGNSRPNPRKRKITICFANNQVDQFKFRTRSAQEAEQWCRHIEEVSSMIYADIRFSNDTVPGTHLGNQTESFRVFLQPSLLVSFCGECNMEVSSSNVIIRDLSHNLLVTWDIVTIRRFGSDGQQLHIETGRSSSTGEGLFEFRCFEAKKIERHLNAVTFAISTAVHVMETDVSQGGSPVVPRRPSQHQVQRHRQQQQQQSMRADGWYLHHAQSEPGHTAGLFVWSDSPPAYRRPSIPTPYPPTTRTQSPPAVTSRTDVFPPMYFSAAAPAAEGRRPSTPVFCRNQSPPLSAFPFDFSQALSSQTHESTSYLESPHSLPERLYHHHHHIASSNDLSLSRTHESTSYLESPPVLPERSRHRHLASSHDLSQLHQQQQQQDRLPDVTSSPPRPTRSANISTSSCPSPSSPFPIHASRRRHPAPPPPPSPPPSAFYDLPPPIPPRLATHSSTDNNDF